MTIDPTASYAVTLDTSCGDVPITLDAAPAPQTVNSFVFLACKGFYNGTTFHRIVTDFVDQGGDPTGDGNGGPGTRSPTSRRRRRTRAATSRWPTQAPGTTGSQFFLVVSDNGAKTLTGSGTPGKYSIARHMDKQGLKVAQKINTFGGADGTPTKTDLRFSTKVSGPTTSSSTTTTAVP